MHIASLPASPCVAKKLARRRYRLVVDAAKESHTLSPIPLQALHDWMEELGELEFYHFAATRLYEVPGPAMARTGGALSLSPVLTAAAPAPRFTVGIASVA